MAFASCDEAWLGENSFTSERTIAGRHKKADRGRVAQLVEHVLGKDEVTGSSPVVGSIGAAIVKFIERRQR